MTDPTFSIVPDHVTPTRNVYIFAASERFGENSAVNSHWRIAGKKVESRKAVRQQSREAVSQQEPQEAGRQQSREAGR